MERIWAVIAIGPKQARILVTAGPGETILKARLSRRILHPRALPTLLESIAQWQGLKVHAVLAVDESYPLFATNRWLDFGGHDDTPLYSLELLVLPARRHRRRGLDGLGDFRDLHSLLAREVAR